MPKAVLRCVAVIAFFFEQPGPSLIVPACLPPPCLALYSYIPGTPQAIMDALPEDWTGELVMVDHMYGYVSEAHGI